jgi:uncharacterized RDD family membrane protein YckC
MSTSVSPVPREARPYQGHRAGMVSRFLANAIDLAVVVAMVLGLYAAWATLRFLSDPAEFSFPHPAVIVDFAVGLCLLVSYLTLAWWLNGRTFGDHLMGLRVVNFRGERLRLAGALARAAFCAAFPLGLFWVAVSRENRSVQDVVLRTSVIYDWQPTRVPQPTKTGDGQTQAAAG